jgi:hypothetical protein
MRQICQNGATNLIESTGARSANVAQICMHRLVKQLDLVLQGGET